MPLLANRFREQVQKTSGWINDALDGMAGSFEGLWNAQHDEQGRHTALTFETIQGAVGPALKAVPGTLDSDVRTTTTTVTSETTYRTTYVKAGTLATDGDTARVQAMGSMEALAQARHIIIRINGVLVSDLQSALATRFRWYLDVGVVRTSATEAQTVGFGCTSGGTIAGEVWVVDPDPVTVSLDTQQLVFELAMYSASGAEVRVNHYAVRFDPA